MGKSSRAKNSKSLRLVAATGTPVPTLRRPVAHAGMKAKRRPRARFHFSGWWLFSIVAVVIVGAIVALVATGNLGQPAAGSSAYQVGSPGPGAEAPPIMLGSTDGSQFDLSAYRGKTVLLFFQEGIGCEPCWVQMKDVEANWAQFQAAGIDKVVAITGNPLAPLKQKVAMEGLTTPVLGDPDMRVSNAYGANQYGMMGTSADGHTFIIVGPDGKIRWRADYGGPPNYTMYVGVPNLLADMRLGMKAGS